MIIITNITAIIITIIIIIIITIIIIIFIMIHIHHITLKPEWNPYQLFSNK